MGRLYFSIEQEVEISELLNECDYFDFKEIKSHILKNGLKDYYSERSNVDPIIAIRLLKEAGVDLKALSIELNKYFCPRILHD